MALGLIYKNQEHIFREVEGTTPYLSYPLLEQTGLVRHCFSTRLGGVSEGCYSSLNLGFHRGDDEEKVLENYRRIGAAIGVSCENMVLSRQTHTTNVRIVTDEDRGSGVVRSRNYNDVDGLITNIPGICLVTSYADCVPLYFVDPVKKVIGLSHSGWRGTVGRMGQVTVEKMTLEFGCDPSDMIAAIGPSVCQDCYEVSEDVIEKFCDTFPETVWPDLFYQKENGKYQLNLWRANQQILLDAGIRKENIAVTNLCTHCNSELLYSHRTMGDQRGNLCAFLALKE